MEQLSLSVGLREAYIPSSPSLPFSLHLYVFSQVIKLKVNFTQLPFKPVLINTAETAKGETMIKAQLVMQESVKAEAEFQLREFFTAGLLGESENWILLNDAPGEESKKKEFTQVKLWMSVQPKAKSPTRKGIMKSLSLGGLQSDPLSPSLAKIETVVKQDRDGDR